jgi:hypothetical protein
MKKKIGSSKSIKKYQTGGEDKPPYVKSVGPKGGTQIVDTTGLAGGAKRFKVTGTKPSGRTVEFETNRKGAQRVIEASKTPGKKHKAIRVMGQYKANPPYREDAFDLGFKKGGSVGKSKMKMGGSCGTPKKLSKKK